MMLLAGTVPLEDFPLCQGEATLDGNRIGVDGRSFPVGMGSGAMIHAAMETLSFFGKDKPHLLLVGDRGEATGSRKLYRKLEEIIGRQPPAILVMHYIQPIVTLMDSLCRTILKGTSKPVMIADAGSLYAAKAAGRARDFDILTPDLAEMKFLADSTAMHPAYVSNFFLQTGKSDVPDLIRRAWLENNAPRYLLVKGKTDYVAEEGKVIHRVSTPDLPLLEPIGGTGDTITGIAAALVHCCYPMDEALLIACRVNREAGLLTDLRPDTRVLDLTRNIGRALERLTRNHAGALQQGE
jgi:hypothetical protein